MIRRSPVHLEIPFNPVGDDWVCSDMHGEFPLLMGLLRDSGFEPATDFSEGLARTCTWGGKISEGHSDNIQNIDMVVSGHIGCEQWVRRGNQLWIDTLLRTGKPTLIRARSLLRVLDERCALS